MTETKENKNIHQNTVFGFYYHRKFVANHAVFVSNFEALKNWSCKKNL